MSLVKLKTCLQEQGIPASSYLKSSSMEIASAIKNFDTTNCFLQNRLGNQNIASTNRFLQTN